MLTTVRQLLAMLLASALLAYGQGYTWDKVRYNGGTLQTKVDPKEWNNHLTVSSDKITVKLKDGQVLEIPSSSVTALSYGQEAHRRVGTMVALGILLTPLALFGLFHKTRLHFIGIEYKTPDGKGAALLLQGHKDNYRAILTALKGTTGAPLAVSDKDREFVPSGLAASVVKEPGSTPAAQAPQTATVAVSSRPEGAEISVDTAFVGNAPATIKVPAGKHTIRLALHGFKEWTKEITLVAGSEVKLTAELDKEN